MKRKITILTIAFLSSVLMCANAFAAATGRCGDSITWTLDDSGNLTLSGSGEMWNYSYYVPPFNDYGIKTVTIGDGITSIGESAFAHCSGLTELTLPNSVTSIGEKAFSDCSGLSEITSLAEIPPVCGSNVFYGVDKTNCELIVPEGSVAAYKQAEGWKEFSNIMGFVAFGRCGDSIIWTLDDSGNLTLSGSGEMWNYSYYVPFFKDYVIKTVTIGDGITSIGDAVFEGCSGLTELTLPNSVTSIGSGAFEGCTGLEKITSLAEIPPVCGREVFDGVNKTNCELIVPEGSVAAYKQARGWQEFSNIRGVVAFGHCGDSITWNFYDSGNLTLSGSGEMWNYNYDVPPFKDYGIKTVTIGDGITSIGDYAFSGCSGLTELTLPNSVTSIGESAFAYCSDLEKITVESGNSRYDSRDNCNSIVETETNTLIVGCKNSIIPNSVTSIGESAFRGCSGLTELTLPNSITSIGEYAFYSCRGLTELTLPNSITSIGDYAFAYCSGLAKITSLAEIPPVCGFKVFNGVNKTNCELIVPEGSVAAYKQAEVWNEFSNISGFSGVEDTVADGNTIRAIGNQIEIIGYFTSVEVYGINGALIYKGKDNVVTVPSAGIYLVHVAGKTRKIVVE